METDKPSTSRNEKKKKTEKNLLTDKTPSLIS